MLPLAIRKQIKLPWVTPGISTQGLMDEKTFRLEIEKERQRAHRLLRPLSLVTYRVEGKCEFYTNKPSIINLLGSSLINCTREYESKGWLIENEVLSVGILLPDTAPHQTDPIHNRVKETFNCSINRLFSNLSNHIKLVTTVRAISLSEDENNTVGAERVAAGSADSRIAPTLVTTRGIPNWKRLFDILISLLGLICALPIFVVLPLFIKIVSPGPIFFCQTRVGYRGQPFTMLKFRTMKPNADNSNHQQYLAQLIAEAKQTNKTSAMAKLEDDPQIIPCGKVIRALCLDEVPQLINVIRGEMSLVGPRPPIPYEADEYEVWHRQRFDAVPGMTGLWQVSGKNRLSFNEMVRLDIRYAHSVSMGRDWRILLSTFPAITEQLRECLSKSKSMTEVARENA